jgi:molybdate transport system substrate-binding protein
MLPRVARPAFMLLVSFVVTACSGSSASELAWLGSLVGSGPEETAPSAPTEPLRLLAAGATEPSVRDTLPQFEADTGLTVVFDFGAVGALRDRVLAGEPADVMVVTPAIIMTLEAQQGVRGGSRLDLGQIGGGIAVRAGDPLPAIDTPEALEQALIDADEV